MDSEVETSIQASKKPKTEKALAGLAAGRARLAEINKAKADAKAQMLKEAFEKKTQRKAERDAKFLKEIDLAIADLSEGEDDEAPPAPVAPKAKPPRAVVAAPRGRPSAPQSSMGSKGNDEFPLHVKAPAKKNVPAPEPEYEEKEVVVKKPKKKVIRYVEESSSEEEEIVYVKREKKAPKTVYLEAPQQRPQILFY